MHIIRYIMSKSRVLRLNALFDAAFDAKAKHNDNLTTQHHIDQYSLICFDDFLAPNFETCQGCNYSLVCLANANSMMLDIKKQEQTACYYKNNRIYILYKYKHYLILNRRRCCIKLNYDGKTSMILRKIIHKEILTTLRKYIPRANLSNKHIKELIKELEQQRTQGQRDWISLC